MSEPNDKNLWRKAKAAAKRKYAVYPSAYANSFAVKWYKERGGTFKGSKKSDEGLTRWHKEEWKNEKGEPCGRDEAKQKGYPYCRPTKRVSDKTPKTWSEISDSEKKKKVSEKRKLEKENKGGKSPDRVKSVKRKKEK